MQSRGIGEKEARMLLMNAFVGEVIDHIAIEALKERIQAMVEKGLTESLVAVTIVLCIVVIKPKKMFNFKEIREDFPILKQEIYNKPLVYFDNAATTQKPTQVIDAELKMYHELNSNIHRGVHRLSELSTEAYEKSRENIKDFINAAQLHEVIFTPGTTASINMVAATFCEKYIRKDDEVITTEMEHHSNIVPWQLACEKKGAKLRVVRIDKFGNLEVDQIHHLINEKQKSLRLLMHLIH